MYAGMRKYGVAATFNFAAYNPDGVDLDTDWVPVQADCELMKDEAASTAITATATDEGVTYSIALNATEMQCARGVIKVQDAVTKVILDIVLEFETYGDPSAQHAFDLDSSTVDVGAINGSITAAVQLALGANTIENGICEGTPTQTVVQTDLAETDPDIYIGRTIIFTGGAARGEATDITDYDGSTGTLTLVALANAPASTDPFIIL